MLGAQVGGFVCPDHRATPVGEFVCRACLVIPTAAAGEQLERHPSEQATRQPRAPRTPVRPSWRRAGRQGEAGSLRSKRHQELSDVRWFFIGFFMRPVSVSVSVLRVPLAATGGKTQAGACQAERVSGGMARAPG